MSILPYVILIIPFGGPVPLLAKLAVTVLLSATAMLTAPTEEDIAQMKWNSGHDLPSLEYVLDFNKRCENWS